MKLQIDNFRIEDDELVIGNDRISNLISQVRSTPFFAYDKEEISSRIFELRSNFPNEVKIHYAIKANSYPPLLKYISNQIDGLDVASKGEIEIALNSGMDPINVTFAGPGKRKLELDYAIRNGVTINLESKNELNECLKIGKSLNIIPKIALRINPDFKLKSFGIEMGGGSSQFGIDVDQVPELLRFIKTKEIKFMGFHIYNGSQSLNEKHLIEMISNSFNLAKNLANQSSIDIKTLNIGPGFGIPYFMGEKDLNMKKIGNSFSAFHNDWKKSFPNSEVILELGRYLVGSCGMYVCAVVDKKISKGKTFLITDGGMHHHLAASGNLGQIIRKNFPIFNAEKISEGDREVVDIVGPLCTSLDVLGAKVEIGKAEIGDYIVILQSGAYAYYASPADFLSHPRPLQILV